MKVNDELKLKAGFRAGMMGRVNKSIKDPLYLLGTKRGDAYYHREFIGSTKDHGTPEISTLREPELVHYGLMHHIAETVTVLRQRMGTSPNFMPPTLEELIFLGSPAPNTA